MRKKPSFNLSDYTHDDLNKLYREWGETIPGKHFKVLLTLEGYENIYPMADNARDLQIPLLEYKSIVKEFYDRGLLRFSVLTREDSNHVCGSGYYCNEYGRQFLEYIRRNLNIKEICDK